jgi:hypothetical protein
MRLRPLQIVGLLAVVGFGIKLVMLLTEPKRDPFHLPGAMPLSAPVEPALPEPPMIAPPVAEAPNPVPADLLSLGSDEAKDDLYCSGLIFAAHRVSPDTLSDAAQERRAQVVALASAGVEKLIAAKAADAIQTGAIADAHAAKAAEDFAAGTPRLTLEACEQRATVLPQQPAQPLPTSNEAQ